MTELTEHQEEAYPTKKEPRLQQHSHRQQMRSQKNIVDNSIPGSGSLNNVDQDNGMAVPTLQEILNNDKGHLSSRRKVTRRQQGQEQPTEHFMLTSNRHVATVRGTCRSASAEKGGTSSKNSIEKNYDNGKVLAKKNESGQKAKATITISSVVTNPRPFRVNMKIPWLISKKMYYFGEYRERSQAETAMAVGLEKINAGASYDEAKQAALDASGRLSEQDCQLNRGNSRKILRKKKKKKLKPGTKRTLSVPQHLTHSVKVCDDKNRLEVYFRYYSKKHLVFECDSIEEAEVASKAANEYVLKEIVNEKLKETLEFSTSVSSEATLLTNKGDFCMAEPTQKSEEALPLSLDEENPSSIGVSQILEKCTSSDTSSLPELERSIGGRVEKGTNEEGFKKWVATINTDGKNEITVGSFETSEEAMTCRKLAEAVWKTMITPGSPEFEAALKIPSHQCEKDIIESAKEVTKKAVTDFRKGKALQPRRSPVRSARKKASYSECHSKFDFESDDSVEEEKNKNASSKKGKKRNIEFACMASNNSSEKRHKSIEITANSSLNLAIDVGRFDLSVSREQINSAAGVLSSTKTSQETSTDTDCMKAEQNGPIEYKYKDLDVTAVESYNSTADYGRYNMSDSFAQTNSAQEENHDLQGNEAKLLYGPHHGSVYQGNGLCCQLRFKKFYIGTFANKSQAMLAKTYAEASLNHFKYKLEEVKEMTLQAIKHGNDELDILSKLDDIPKTVLPPEGTIKKRPNKKKERQSNTMGSKLYPGSVVAGKRARKKTMNAEPYADFCSEIPTQNIPNAESSSLEIPEHLTLNLPAKEDSNVYKEESAWRFHNKLVENEENVVEPLPPAPDLPPLPKDSPTCDWEFNEESRVLLANFRKAGNNQIHLEDEKFLLEMMERDDITVISEGLADNLNSGFWNPEFIAGAVGGDYYHKFRKFKRRIVNSISVPTKDSIGYEEGNQGDKNHVYLSEAGNSGTELVGTPATVESTNRLPAAGDSLVKYEEMDRFISIKISDYVRYLNLRRDALARIAAGEDTERGIGNGCKTDAFDSCVTKVIPAETESLEEANGKENDARSVNRAFEQVITDTEVKADMQAAIPSDGCIDTFESTHRKNNPLPSEGTKVDSEYEPEQAETSSKKNNPNSFSFKDDSGHYHTIDVTEIALYMIDFDLVKLLPNLYDDFRNCFKLPGCLPGGAHCMMHDVNVGGRPFMGPNLYVTPPTSFTHFHQDGHGTVDSGHQCLSGYNEVVMLRRLTERHKKHALYLLNGGDRKINGYTQYDGLYKLPHGDGLGEKPMWPDTTAIDECKRMRYYPSVFILKPGQLVHINKGRLHAFRKLSPDVLPKDDCHANLRKALKDTEKMGHTEHLCVSVAWDWMYRGVTSEGINREIVSTLECAALNRKEALDSLAIPELSLLQMARNLASSRDSVTNWLPFKKIDHEKGKHFLPSNKDILKGILPSLRYVVTQHVRAAEAAKEAHKEAVAKESIPVEEETEDYEHFESNRKGRLNIEDKPNAWQNPEIFALDPYGNGDFFCKLCSKELSNVYMHCDGCEIILKKDFNICESCHREELYAKFIQMHPLNKKRHCTINHTGDMKYDRKSRCPCKNGPACSECGFCQGCSCRCHRSFTLNYRFLSIEEEQKMLARVEELVGPHDDAETTARLEYIGLDNSIVRK